MKRIVLLLAAVSVLASCTREFPVVDPSAMDNRNIGVRIYKFWNGALLDTNKVLEINGDKIKIDNIYLTMSAFRFVDSDGSVQPTQNDLSAVNLIDTREVMLGYLPDGNYNGTILYRIGLDSARSFTAPDQLDATNPLKSGVVWNGSDIGHSYFQIEGGIFDPADTVMSKPTKNFVWRVATPDLRINQEDKRNFNVPTSKDVFFVMNLDVEKLFLGLSPSLTPVILSDPGDFADYSLAQILRNNLQSELQFEQ